MAKTNPLQFMQQVRSETEKVVWPNRRETLLTTGMVFLLSALAATFFSIIDIIIRFGMDLFIAFSS
ncbi:MAG: preprotein translocase subunit SecE [Pseudomonadota bacterium]